MTQTENNGVEIEATLQEIVRVPPEPKSGSRHEAPDPPFGIEDQLAIAWRLSERRASRLVLPSATLRSK